MAKSYMQMIFIDDEDNARQTGRSAEANTNAETRAAFNAYRHHDVPIDQARFLLDYYNAKGDLADTIRLDEAGFRAITGQEPLTNAEYIKIDEEYWTAARTVGESDR